MYDTLVLSGGGVKGFAMLGTLQYLEHQKKIKNIKKIIGTSIGSVIGYLYVLGYKPNEIIIECIQNDYFSKIEKVNIVKGIKGEGFLDFDFFYNILYKFTYDKIKEDKKLTFKDLYEINNIELIMLTFNYTNKCEEILSFKTTPDLFIVEAIRMTSNLPFVFGNFQYKDCYYFDGFISRNFPIHLIDIKNDIVFGICSFRDKWKDDKELKYWKIIWNLFFLPFFEIQSIKNEIYYKYCDIVNLDLDISLFGFYLSSKKVLDLFSIGYSKMKEIESK